MSEYSITPKGLAFLALTVATAELEDDTTLSYETIALVRKANAALHAELREASGDDISAADHALGAGI